MAFNASDGGRAVLLCLEGMAPSRQRSKLTAVFFCATIEATSVAKSESHRWGGMNSDQSWTPLARDVDRALAHAGLNYGEAILMQYIREHSWGDSVRAKKKGDPWKDALVVAWSPGEISRKVGLAGNRLAEAKASLVKSNMLIEIPEGLLINKHAHKWVIPGGRHEGKPRLSSAAIAYAMSAWPKPKTSEIPEDDFRNHGNGFPESRKEISGKTEEVFRESGNGFPENGKSHYKERPQEDPTESRSIESEQTARPRLAEEPEDEAILAFEQTPEPSQEDKNPPSGFDSKEAIDLARWAQPLGSDPNSTTYAWWAREQCKFSPASWAKSILMKKVLAVPRRPSIRVLTSIINAWRIKGEPEWDIEEAKPKPETVYHTAPAGSPFARARGTA